MSFLFLLGLKIREKKSVHERQRKTVLRGEGTTLRMGGVGGWGERCDKDAQKNKRKWKTKECM